MGPRRRPVRGLTTDQDNVGKGARDQTIDDSLARLARGRESIRWSGLAVIGRQLSQMLAALVLARILGPDTYGVISAATIYVTLSTLVLDQGLAAALVQRPKLNVLTPGAVATVNIVTAVLLAALTWFLAPLVADFFSATELTGLLRILGVGLLLKALAITPRAMLQRHLRFAPIAAADIAGGVTGAAVGISAGLLGASYWAMAGQVLTTDAVIGAVMLVRYRGGLPNLHLGQLRSVFGFGLRIFGSNALAFLARNLDNILVGRFLGLVSLSYYSMAYRVLVIPVQMLGQTVNRVTFPTFARLADRPAQLASTLTRATELLSFAAIPAMGLVAVAAPELVAVVLGDEWAVTAPVLTVLAVAGARETVFYITGALMRAKGAGKLILRYEFVATGTQLTGIVIGLQFGVLGVALGVTTAGFVLAVPLLVIQRHLAGVRIRTQLLAILPAAHASLWAAGGYLLIKAAGWNTLVVLLVGSGMYVLVGFGILAVFHRTAARRSLAAALGIIGFPRGSRTVAGRAQ